MAALFESAGKLNSRARQAMAQRAIFAIGRFFSNCKALKPGNKGYPPFKKQTRSVKYNTSGWKLSSDKRRLTFSDGFAAGTFKLVGSGDLHFYAPDEMPASPGCQKGRWLLCSVLRQRKTDRGNQSSR